MTPADRREFDELRMQVEILRAVLLDAHDYAGAAIADAASPPEPEMGQLLALPAGRKAIRKRAAGRAAAGVTTLAASRRVSTPGRTA